MRLLRCFAVVAAAVLVQAVAPTAGTASPDRFFAPDSLWNAPLPAQTPTDPASSRYVAKLEQLAKPRPQGGYASSIMTTSYGVPIYTVGPNVPQVTVRLAAKSPALASAFAQVPLPTNARPAPGTDGNLLVWQPATDTLWEFWRLQRRSDGWHAAFGGRMTDVSTSPGFYRDRVGLDGQWLERAHWGTTAAKASLVAGVMTVEELRRNRIDHALSFALPEVRAGQFSAPAQATDGKVRSSSAIPMGARFRLPADLDIGALELPRPVDAMARAVQRYGMVLVNTSGGVGFRAEDPAQLGFNPYPGIFGGTVPALLMRTFPWRKLELMPLQLVGSPVDALRRAR